MVLLSFDVNMFLREERESARERERGVETERERGNALLIISTLTGHKSRPELTSRNAARRVASVSLPIRRLGRKGK